MIFSTISTFLSETLRRRFSSHQTKMASVEMTINGTINIWTKLKNGG